MSLIHTRPKVNIHGYVIIDGPDGKRGYEHRIRLIEHGKDLTRCVVVHKNGDNSDNRLNNLKIVPVEQAYPKIHELIRDLKHGDLALDHELSFIERLRWTKVITKKRAIGDYSGYLTSKDDL